MTTTSIPPITSTITIGLQHKQALRVQIKWVLLLDGFAKITAGRS